MKKPIYWKVCTKCGRIKPRTNTNEYFNWLNKEKGYLKSRCKECQREDGFEYKAKNKEKVLEYQRLYNAEHKEEIKEWHKNNPEKLKEYSKRTCIKHRERRRNRSRKAQQRYRKENPEISKEYSKQYRVIYYSKNKEKLKQQQREYYKEHCNDMAFFATYAPQLTIDEDPKDDGNGYLLVKCAYCGKYFGPTNNRVVNRISALNGHTRGEYRLYCSDGCKAACPIFNQQKWPRGYKKATSREVDPLIRQMCLKRDDYTCQKCGATIDEAELHCHHIEGATQMPLLANDVDNTITLCKSCHKWVHRQKDCTYYDLRCKK